MRVHQEAGAGLLQLSRRSALDRTPAVRTRDGRRFERRAKRFVVAQRLEIGVISRERAIFRIQRDRAFEVRHGFGVLLALRVSDGEHVDRMIVVGILVAHEPQVRDRLIVLPAVDRQGRRVQPLVDRLGRRFTLRRLTLADIEIQPDALVQLLLFGVLTKDSLEQVGRLRVRVALERLEPPLVERNGLDIRGTALGRGRRRRGHRNPLLVPGFARPRHTRAGPFQWRLARFGGRPPLLLGHKGRASLRFFFARRGR